MNNRTCVVTGANSGVGFEATSSLARLGAKVVLVCRDRARGEGALERLSRAVPSGTFHLEVADLASLAQVRELGRALSDGFPEIHLLVNNAGAYGAKLERTVDGFERTLAVNHLSHFLLTHLLLPRLLAVGGRVINVSSEAHRRGRLRVETLEETIRGRSRYSAMGAYCDSKLANVLFTSELARRYDADQLTACAVHPGVLATRIWNQNRDPISLFMRLLKPLLGRAAVGGDAVGFLAEEPAEIVHGRYFNRKRAVKPAHPGLDQALAGRLWDLSLSMVGLPPSDD